MPATTSSWPFCSPTPCQCVKPAPGQWNHGRLSDHHINCFTPLPGLESCTQADTSLQINMETDLFTPSFMFKNVKSALLPVLYKTSSRSVFVCVWGGGLLVPLKLSNLLTFFLFLFHDSQGAVPHPRWLCLCVCWSIYWTVKPTLCTPDHK